MERSLDQGSIVLGLDLELSLPELIAYLSEPWLHKLWKTSEGYGEVMTKM